MEITETMQKLAGIVPLQERIKRLVAEETQLEVEIALAEKEIDTLAEEADRRLEERKEKPYQGLHKHRELAKYHSKLARAFKTGKQLGHQHPDLAGDEEVHQDRAKRLHALAAFHYHHLSLVHHELGQHSHAERRLQAARAHQMRAGHYFVNHKTGTWSGGAAKHLKKGLSNMKLPKEPVKPPEIPAEPKKAANESVKSARVSIMADYRRMIGLKDVTEHWTIAKPRGISAPK